MNKTIAEITIVPLGTATTSLSQYVADVEKVLSKYSDLKYELTPMSTVVEGNLDTILEAAREMHETPFLNGAMRVSTRLSIDDRRDKSASMDAKVQAVRSKL